ncbi:MAG: hypothetical protein FD180_4958 [Planctomycetota bacterium]|nr:MAG: hypothetical protein FD180_4958 [Planctomycetota bacterium]
MAALVDEAPRAAKPSRAPVPRARIAAAVAIASYAWILGFVFVASHVHDAGGLALLGATYLIAPGAVYRLAARHKCGLLLDTGLLVATTLLLAAGTAYFIPVAVRMSREQLSRQARAEAEWRVPVTGER